MGKGLQGYAGIWGGFFFENFFYHSFFRERSIVRSWKLQENGVGGLNRKLPFLNAHNWQKGDTYIIEIPLLTNGTLQYSPFFGFFL